MYDAIIFDMDGTLINYVKQIQESWNNTFLKLSIQKVVSHEQIQSVMGMTKLQIAQKFFPELEIKRSCAIIEQACEEQVIYFKTHVGKTYIPNEDFLKQLSRKYDLYIVSNCLDGYIEMFYEKFGYQKYFKGFQNGSNGKVKGENIQILMERYHLQNPLYVGDTILDYQACQMAHVDFMHASYGFGKVENVKKIDKLEDLLSLGE